jgi:DNA-binding MarR family transcriptional regulator
MSNSFGDRAVGKKGTQEPNLPEDPLSQLYRRPGFLIRRAHQISVAVFMEKAKDFGVTPTQFGIIQIVKYRPAIDQVTVAKLLGLDRSTTAMVVSKLVDAGLVDRAVGPHDRRRRSLQLTPAGAKMYEKLQGPAERSRTELLSVFSPTEAKQFLQFLERLTSSFSGLGRVHLNVPQLPSGRAKHATAKQSASRKKAKPR